MPFKFQIGRGRVIKGWDQGFATMKVGEKAYLTCGPSFAYGASGSPTKIPPGATLRFEVELLGFVEKEKEEWEMSVEEKLAAGEKRKSAGNSAFVKGDLHGALDEYNRAWKAVEYCEEAGALKGTIKSNAAQVHLKLGDAAGAKAAAEAATQADPKNSKAWFRLGCAESALGAFKAARAALVEAGRLSPGDAAVKAEFEKVKGLQAKAKAISVGAWAGMFTQKGLSLGVGDSGAGEGSKPVDSTVAGDAYADLDEEEEEEEDGKAAAASEKLDEE